MKARVEKWKGSLKIISGQNGTRLQAEMPV